jgi:hypothetical protein
MDIMLKRLMQYFHYFCASFMLHIKVLFFDTLMPNCLVAV